MRLARRLTPWILAAIATSACSDPVPREDPGEAVLLGGFCSVPDTAPITYNAAGRGSPCLIWSASGTTLYAVVDTAYPHTQPGAPNAAVKELVSLTRAGGQWTPSVVRRIPTPVLLGVSDASDAIYVATITNAMYNTITIWRVSVTSAADPVAVTTAYYGPILVSADDRVLAFRSPGATPAATDSIVVLDRMTGARKSFAADLSRVVAVNADGTTVLFRTRSSDRLYSLDVSSGTTTETATPADVTITDAAWVGSGLHMLTRRASDNRVDVSPDPLGQAYVRSLGPLAWAPAGRAFVDHAHSTTFDQSGVAGDRTEFLAASPSFTGSAGSVNMRASGVVLSPDGKWLAYLTPYAIYVRAMP